MRRLSDEETEKLTLEAVLREVHRKSVNIRILYLASFVLFVVVIGLAMVVQNVDHNVESNRRTAEKTDQTSQRTQVQIDHLEQFVNKLEAPPSASEAAQNQAVSEAVALVPQIRNILCEQFPKATNCQPRN